MSLGTLLFCPSLVATLRGVAARIEGSFHFLMHERLRCPGHRQSGRRIKNIARNAERQVLALATKRTQPELPQLPVHASFAQRARRQAHCAKPPGPDALRAPCG
jgi:hypothetical protein